MGVGDHRCRASGSGEVSRIRQGAHDRIHPAAGGDLLQPDRLVAHHAYAGSLDRHGDEFRQCQQLEGSGPEPADARSAAALEAGLAAIPRLSARAGALEAAALRLSRNHRSGLVPRFARALRAHSGTLGWRFPGWRASRGDGFTLLRLWMMHQAMNSSITSLRKR